MVRSVPDHLEGRGDDDQGELPDQPLDQANGGCSQLVGAIGAGEGRFRPKAPGQLRFSESVGSSAHRHPHGQVIRLMTRRQISAIRGTELDCTLSGFDGAEITKHLEAGRRVVHPHGTRKSVRSSPLRRQVLELSAIGSTTA